MYSTLSEMDSSKFVWFESNGFFLQIYENDLSDSSQIHWID